MPDYLHNVKKSCMLQICTIIIFLYYVNCDTCDIVQPLYVHKCFRKGRKEWTVVVQVGAAGQESLEQQSHAS